MKQLFFEITENSSDTPVDPAHGRAVHEVVVHEGVDGHRKTLSAHHQQIRDGQVHDEDVGLKSVRIWPVLPCLFIGLLLIFLFNFLLFSIVLIQSFLL